MRTYERFLRYIAIDTTSSHQTGLHPSTPSQKILGALLVEEMKTLNLVDVSMDDKSYVYGTIPATIDHPTTIGFIAHLDTSSDVSGKNITPRLWPNYQGEDLILNQEHNVVLSCKEYPLIKYEFGRTLITTDGTTLLGADDKAGIAEIMTMAEILMKNPNIPHGTIKIAFTPDEEIGEGADFFDIKGFGCDFAYTLDGGQEGEINYENFNAASGNVIFHGVNIHPGSAKDKMINAIHLAMEFDQSLPADEIPARTEGYQGFYHLNGIQGSVEEARASYIIRNHDKNLFNKQKQLFIELQDCLNQKYGRTVCEVHLKDTYYNMFEKMKDHLEIVEYAIQANKAVGITTNILPIRGGTDGARLTYDGLLCPNLATGGYYAHGKHECISIEAMDCCTEVLLELIKQVYQDKM